MQLIPIKKQPDENGELYNNPLCRETIDATIEFYGRVGFVQPWIGYFVEDEGSMIGAAGFKGEPKNGAVEIAYGVFEEYRNRGIGRQICRMLVNLCIDTDSSLKIMARTMPEENYSTRILRKNNFFLTGSVIDPEDGEVFEWQYKGQAQELKY
jgi:ribosomal-protein-alanine N-acetyltransferase